MSEPITAEISSRICAHMNDDHADAVLLYVRTFGKSPEATEAEMLAIDPQGMNIAARLNGAAVPVRIEFDRVLENAEDAHQTLIAMVKQARAQSK